MATEAKGLKTLFTDGLKDIYYAENKILKALPKHAPEKPESFEKIFADFEKIIVPGITHTPHPELVERRPDARGANTEAGPAPYSPRTLMTRRFARRPSNST